MMWKHQKEQSRRFKRLKQRLALFFGKQEKFISEKPMHELWIDTVYIPEGSRIINYKKYVVIIRKKEKNEDNNL